MDSRDNHNNEELDFLIDVPLSSERDSIEVPMPNVEENMCIPLQHCGKN